VRESRSPGSVRGVLSNGHSYRDSLGPYLAGEASNTAPVRDLVESDYCHGPMVSVIRSTSAWAGVEVVGSGYDIYDGSDRSCTWEDFREGCEGPEKQQQPRNGSVSLADRYP